MAEYRTVVGKDGISRDFKVTKLESQYRPSKSVMRVKGRMSNSSGRVNLLMVPAGSSMGTDS